ncbi:hypothetical protein C8R46DRAFT_1268728 [Mycena filopes]|nr:hypothetical protein C8R46DRAFT_1268728 [Mycena filopes]
MHFTDRHSLSAEKPIPPEILSKIFEATVADTPIAIPLRSGAETHPAFQVSEVCQRWRGAASTSPIWNRIAAKLDETTYPTALAQIHRLFGGAAPRKGRTNLSIELRLGKTLGRAPHLSFTDIIQPYASRIVDLDLELNLEVVEKLVRLPAETFPHLQRLRLLVARDLEVGGWIVWGPTVDTDITEMSALAPRLSSLEFDESLPSPLEPWEVDRELCTFYPSQIGLNFTTLAVLHIVIALPCGRVRELLRHCVCLEVCMLVVEMDELRGAESTTLPALHSLRVQFQDPEVSEPFFDQLQLPGLKLLILFGDFTFDLLRFLQRSNAVLAALCIHSLTGMSQERFTQLLSTQSEITSLEVSHPWDDGYPEAFWAGLEQVHPVLLPRLEHFARENFVAGDVSHIIALINARCTPSTPGGEVFLKTVRLSPLDVHEECVSDCPMAAELRVLEDSIEAWTERGISVTLTEGTGSCPYCWEKLSEGFSGESYEVRIVAGRLGQSEVFGFRMTTYNPAIFRLQVAT